MRVNWRQKLFAAVIVGITYGFYLRHAWEERAKAGREAFLRYEAGRWEHYYARPHHELFFIAGVVLSLAFIGLYEGITVALIRMGPPADSQSKN